MLLNTYKLGRARVMLPDIWVFAEPLLTSFECVTTKEAHVTDQIQACRPRETTPTQDPSLHLLDRFWTAPSTANQIPGLRQIPSKPFIRHLSQVGFQARRPMRHKVLMAHNLVERLQHHDVALINVTGGIFQHDNARTHTA